MVAAAAALNDELLAPAATVTEAGTVSEGLLLPSATVDPPAGALRVSVAVQLLIAFGPRLAGLQTNAETRTGARRLTIAV
jgi:hypothetical protein